MPRQHSNQICGHSRLFERGEGEVHQEIPEHLLPVLVVP